MFEWLKNMFTTIQSSSDSVVGVDIGSSYLKVVQLRRKSGKAVLETYGSLALGPYAGVEIGRATHLPAEKISEALRDLLREAHVTSNKAACAIPFASSLVTTMDMRVLDPKQLATSVSLEARKYIPVPISEVNLDWWIIPEEQASGLDAKSGSQETTATTSPVATGATSATPTPDHAVDSAGPRMMKILIAAIHNEAFSRYQTAIKGSGLEAGFFEIELFSTIRSLFPQDMAPHAVLDLGAGETKLYLIDRGIIRLSHIIGHGGQDITLALSRGLGISVGEAEKQKRVQGLQGAGKEKDATTAILNLIFGETGRVLESFEHRYGHGVTDVILTGGGANLLGIEEAARQVLSAKVLRANPFTQVEAPAFLDELLSGVGPEFTVAIGIAFRKLQEAS